MEGRSTFVTNVASLIGISDQGRNLMDIVDALAPFPIGVRPESKTKPKLIRAATLFHTGTNLDEGSDPNTQGC